MPQKIALCFLVSRNIVNLNVWREWWAGQKEKINMYAHFSNKKGITQAELCENRVRAVRTQWGDISLVKAEYELYNEAYRDKNNKFFILLSETCVPIRKFSVVYNRLMKDRKRGMASYRSIGRYDEDLTPFRAKCSDLMDQYQFFDRTCYACDQWKALSRSNVTDFFKMWEDEQYVELFSKYCLHVVPDNLAPDELMFINYLRLKKGKLSDVLRNRVVTYVDFKGKAIHPIAYRQLTSQLSDDLCTTDSLFARKFANPLEKRLLAQLPLTC